MQQAEKYCGARYQVVVREGGRGTCKHTRFADTLAEAREAQSIIRKQLDSRINPAATRKGVTLGEIFRRSNALALHPNADTRRVGRRMNSADASTLLRHSITGA